MIYPDLSEYHDRSLELSMRYPHGLLHESHHHIQQHTHQESLIILLVIIELMLLVNDYLKFYWLNQRTSPVLDVPLQYHHISQYQYNYLSIKVTSYLN